MLLPAIASGVGSLFGSGKLKELEHHIEQLHQEITKRDKATDELKIQIQQIQEQHSRQIRNLQRIHNQELEAKDKEISRLSTLLEKAHKWFPMFKEMLRMEKLCAVIGFTKDMIENLLTRKNPYNVVAKFIPKNTGGNLTSRMIFLGLRNIRWIVVAYADHKPTTHSTMV